MNKNISTNYSNEKLDGITMDLLKRYSGFYQVMKKRSGGECFIQRYMRREPRKIIDRIISFYNLDSSLFRFRFCQSKKDSSLLQSPVASVKTMFDNSFKTIVLNKENKAEINYYFSKNDLYSQDGFNKFVFATAHEVAHVRFELDAFKHRKKEVAVDLMAILMGFERYSVCDTGYLSAYDERRLTDIIVKNRNIIFA